MQKINPCYSVITVTYNAEQFLERTLQSVSEQDYTNIEYIIVDGASKDNTLKLAAQYNNTITKLVSEPDKGLYDAMNKAIQLATGDYLCFLNAGDTFYSSTILSEVSNSISKSNALPDVIYGQTAIVNNGGEFLRMRRLTAPVTLNWKSFKSGMLVCHQAFWPRRDLVDFYDLQYRYSSDFNWCIEILKRSKTNHNTKLTLINYLNEGLTTENQYKSLSERFRIMAKHYGLPSTIARHIGFILRHFLKR